MTPTRKRLGVNIDHVATLRQARRGQVPEPAAAASIAEHHGADGITVHLREDRRHIQDRDLEVLKSVVTTRINLEMAATDEITGIACALKPHSCTLVPEKREEITTEGGLDVLGHREAIAQTSALLKSAGIVVSMFIDPDLPQVRASRQAGRTRSRSTPGHSARRSARGSTRRSWRRSGRRRRSAPPSGSRSSRVTASTSGTSSRSRHPGDRGVQHRAQHHRPGGLPRAAGGRERDRRPHPWSMISVTNIARSGFVASEGGAPFVARRAMNPHGCALPHCAPPPPATSPERETLKCAVRGCLYMIVRIEAA